MDQDQQIHVRKPFYRRFFTFKILILTLVLLGAIEGFYLFKSYSASTIPPPPQVEGIKGGEIVLLSSKDTLKINEGVRVTIKISTGGRPTRGSDVILKFDPDYLEGATSSIYKSRVYPEFPQVSLDNKSGILKISAVSPESNVTFNGVGTLAFLDFKAKKAGKTTISIDFEKNKTGDSNIIEAGSSNDILEKVNELNLNIY